MDRLNLKEQLALAGAWIALEVYTPDTLPERRIAAAAATLAECIQQIRAAGLDVRRFEFRPYKRPI